MENTISIKEKQIHSKKRVADHGEVYTSTREVNAMLDLVKQETDRIDSRFLEPACGNGNFLSEILSRKLKIVKDKYSASQIEYERYSILAVSSIYGIDILLDNVESCRERLYGIIEGKYSKLYKNSINKDYERTVRYILEKNIVFGDALTLQTSGENPKPIVFSEWSAVNGNLLKRRDFTFHGLLEHQNMASMPLFSDLGEDVFIPEPIKDFPLVHFLKVAYAE